MPKDGPSGSGAARPSPRKAAPSPPQTPPAAGAVASGAVAASGCPAPGAPPAPPPAPCAPLVCVAHEEHRRELEALRAELEAERLRGQEARRRFALESRELREAAERDRQLLADQLRSKWEQQRARELRQVRESGARQREAEIRQLLRWKEAELREAQDLLLRERDAAMRQARELQRQLAEELVGRGAAGSGGGSAEPRARLQEVLGKLRWEVDGEQAARIRHLRAELELERSLFLKYILERFEGAVAAASPTQSRRAAAGSAQPRPGLPQPPPRAARARPRSLDGLPLPRGGDNDGKARAAASLGAAGGRQQRAAPEAAAGGAGGGGGAPAEAEEAAPVKGSGGDSAGAEHDEHPGGGYKRLVAKNAELLRALSELERRCTGLREENSRLRRSSFPEMEGKVEKLRRKNAELAGIARRLEEKAQRLHTSSRLLGPGDTDASGPRRRPPAEEPQPQPQTPTEEPPGDLAEEERQPEAEQRPPWGQEGAPDLERLLRESQLEVLRLQRQIMLKSLPDPCRATEAEADEGTASPAPVAQESGAGGTSSGEPRASEEAPGIPGAEGDPEPGASPPASASGGPGSGPETEWHLQDLKERLAERVQQCEDLRRLVGEKQERCRALEAQLSKILSGQDGVLAENARLREQYRQVEEVRKENAEIQVKLARATDERDDAIRLAKALESKVENLEQIIRDMREIAERQQRLELEHKKSLLALQKKEEEIKHLQQMQSEMKREYEDAVKILEAQVRELENQYNSQTEHFHLLSEELEKLQVKKNGLLESQVLQAACAATAAPCPEKWEQDAFRHKPRSRPSGRSGHSAPLESVDSPPEAKLESRPSSSEQSNSRSSLNPEEQTVSETERPDGAKAAANLPLESPGASELRVFLARYSYDPFDGPNKNPEAELPLTAGEYVYIFGGVDEDGFYEGELMDGRRGMVPSNFVEEVSGNDLISFVSAETGDVSHTSYRESGFPSASSEEKSDSPEEDVCVNELHGRLGAGVPQGGVPHPQNLTLIKQFARSVIIGWDPPPAADALGEIRGYNVYVNADLCQNVKPGGQLKVAVENLDVKLHSYRISVQSVTDEGSSDRMRCTLLVGNGCHVAPARLDLKSVTATSALITWLPSSSNYPHVVYLDEKECGVAKPGVYWYAFQNLRPNTRYSIKVEAQAPSRASAFPQGGLEHNSKTVSFSTTPAGPPDAPLDVQVQLSSSAEFLVISWLPVTIDALGSSNGVQVIGYAVYINGQKITEIMSPTAGSTALAVPQLDASQESWKLSVRTLSPFGESEDSVPALLPSPLLRACHALPSQSTEATEQGELSMAGNALGMNQRDHTSGESCSYPEPGVSAVEFAPTGGNCKDSGSHKVSPQGDTSMFSEKKHMKQIKQLCKELSNLTVSKVKADDVQLSGTESWRGSFEDHLRASELSDTKQESKGFGGDLRGREDEPRTEPPRVPNSSPQRSFVPADPGPDDPRLFVALFDYDPQVVSPDSEAGKEQLPFKEGQILKVVGDKDAHGYYRGECKGKAGYIPCHMVSEMYIESKEVKEHLLRSNFMADESL